MSQVSVLWSLWWWVLLLSHSFVGLISGRNHDQRNNASWEIFESRGDISRKSRRSLILKAYPVPDVGTSELFSGKTVFGCLLKTWDTKELFPVQLRSFINESNIYMIRGTLFDNLKPLPMLQWPAIEFRPCPHFQHNIGHRNEKGHCASHSQIWLEFVFFDQDILEARYRYKPEYLTSTAFSSVSGTFQVKEDGALIKNNIPYLDDDLMFIFEDGIQVAPHFNISGLMADIQAAEPFDVLPLMNCSNIRQQNMVNTVLSSRSHSHGKHNINEEAQLSSSMCLAAYVIKRKAAKLLSRIVDVCGKRVEYQLTAFAEEEIITIGQLKSPRLPYFVDYFV